MTKVEECTNADTGVGAAIAAGNHLENGIWALLVIAATTKTKNIVILPTILDEDKIPKLYNPELPQIPIVIKIATSPKRFVKAVNILALNLFSLA